MNTSAFRRPASAFAAALITALLLVACGGDYTTPATPTIGSFSATPAALPAGGGSVQLSWTTSGADQLAVDNGVGDVSGLASTTATVTAGTTFTLTATNATGSATSTTAVTVAAATAPTISAFTATPAMLPVGGGSTTLSWTTVGATSLSIDNGVGDVSGLTSKAVNVAANTTFTLTATNAVGTVSSTLAIAIAQAANRYVDSVNGSDGNPCTQAAPCRSIFTALTGAPAGTTLALADGIYSQSTEGTFSANLPDGVTLRATHPGAVTLADVSLHAKGSATIDGVVFGIGGAPNATACGAISAGGTSTAVTLNLIGVFSNCSGWLGLGANVHATMTPGALAGGQYTSGLAANASTWVSVFSTAQLLIQGGVIEGNGTGVAREQSGVLDVLDGGVLTLDGVTLRNYAGIAIHTRGTTHLQNGTLVDHVGAAGDPGPLASNLDLCTTDSAIVVGDPGGGTLTMDHSTLSNAPSAGICVAANVNAAFAQSLQVTHSTITGIGGAAIEGGNYNASGSPNLGSPVSIDSSTLSNNGRAIIWLGRAGTVFTVTNTTITGSTGAANTGGSGTDTCLGAAVHFDVSADSGSFKLRGSTISNNAAEGLCLASFSGALTADLGTSADPGGNTLTGNAAAGVRVINALATTVNAVGNTWTPSQQGADANGRYSIPPSFATVPKVGPASGVNFTIDNNVSTLNL